MRFAFIHSADLHIDSPLAGLHLKDAEVAKRFAQAGRRAVEALVEETIASKAAFLIIAGDVFDGDWKDVATGLFFVRVISALHRAGIPAFIVKGNHDAESLMSRELPYPDTVKFFKSSKAETYSLDDLRVALHGRSFPTRLNADFVETYPKRRDGWLNIGVLHTSLDGTRGHEGYAPCSVEDFKRYDYDYWALGHIHAYEIVSRDPWIVFPGNLQGRSVRESGAKGAVRVTVEDGRIVDVTPLALDGARWAHVTVDITGFDSEYSVLAQITGEIAQAYATSEARPMALRITLTGATPLHNQLIARRETIQEDVRSNGFHLSPDCWVEQLKVKTTMPARVDAPFSAADELNVDTLLAEAASDPEFAAVLVQLTDDIKFKMPKELHDYLQASDVLKSLTDDARALLAGARS